MNVVVEEHYTRSSEGGVGFKAAGNYVKFILSYKESRKPKGFQQGNLDRCKGPSIH